MSIFWKREKHIMDKLVRYFAVVDKAFAQFDCAMRCYIERGAGEEFRAEDGKLHAAESRADDLRREIEKSLYARALLPESRGDLLGLLETFDKLPNLVETITGMIETQQILLPAHFREDLQRLLEINLEAYRLVREQVDTLFNDPDAVGQGVEPVDAAESESDRVERDLVRRIFRSDIHRVDMLLLRELVSKLGDISDHAEDLSRRMEIIALKRRV